MNENIGFEPLRDALDAVMMNPTGSHEWHRLTACLGVAEAQPLRAAVVAELTAAPIEASAEGFLRATFLASASGDVKYSAIAAGLLPDIRPLFPDRLAAFIACESALALQCTPTRDAFVERLRAIRVPMVAQRLAQEVEARHPPRLPERAIGVVGKVAIIAPYLGGPMHTPTRMVLEQARVLLAQGLEVHALSAQELTLRDMSHFYGDGGRVSHDAPDPEVLGRIAPPGLRIHIAGKHTTLMSRYPALLERLRDFDPDLVFLIGLHSPLAAMLHRVRPVLGLATNSVPPISPVDAWLAADAALDCRQVRPWAPDIPACEAHYHPFRVAMQLPAAPASRARLGLPEEALLLITVGFRLPDEIGGRWAARMVTFLREHPQATWILLGGAGVRPPRLAEIPDERLILLATRDDVPDVLAACDVLVNPPRVGGGFSVAEAMAASLPVVTHSGSDGGDKVGDSAVPDDDAYFGLLGRLVDDAQSRNVLGAQMRTIFAARLDLASSGPSLLKASEKAVVAFHRRRATPVS